MWHVAEQLRAHMTTEDALSLVLVLLAVMSKSSPDWQMILYAPPETLDVTIRSSRPFALPLR